MLKEDRKIIHLEDKTSGEHRYYGSVAALFDDPRTRELLGMSYASFRRIPLSKDCPYENDSSIIRVGRINIIDHN